MKEKERDIRKKQSADRIELYSVVSSQRSEVFKEAAANVNKKKGKKNETYVSVSYSVGAKPGEALEMPEGKTINVFGPSDQGVSLVMRDEKTYKSFWKEVAKIEKTAKKGKK